MKLPDSLRDKFKVPMGILLLEKDVTKQNILKHIQDKFVITVGDRTTEKMIAFDLVPSLQIIDSQEKRVKRELPTGADIKTDLTCNNPAAEITEESISAIKKALSSPTPVRLVVNGEEDLLVLPVCIEAPQNSVVMYGQPNQGLVIVEVTSEIRNKAQRLLDLME